MNKITYEEMARILREHNEKNEIRTKDTDPNPIYGVIVYREDNWEQKFPLASRSYKVSSDNKAYISNQCGYSIYGDALDGSDNGVRLDWYRGQWKIDYCYIIEEKGETYERKNR